jgi:hypothetical protein
MIEGVSTPAQVVAQYFAAIGSGDVVSARRLLKDDLTFKDQLIPSTTPMT